MKIPSELHAEQVCFFPRDILLFDARTLTLFPRTRVFVGLGN